MGSLQGREQLAHHHRRLSRLQPAAGSEDLPERPAPHVLHDHEVGAVAGAPVVHLDGIGVGQACGRLGLRPEALDEARPGCELLGQHLDGDRTAEDLVPRPEDLAHAPRADAGGHPVAAGDDLGGGRLAHGPFTASG